MDTAEPLTSIETGSSLMPGTPGILRLDPGGADITVSRLVPKEE
jgi:hypothetical protein